MKGRLLVTLLALPALCIAQSSTENYVKTETMLDADGSSSMVSVQYYDGLGYPTVQVGHVGGGENTAYSLVTYDALGRAVRKYVPVSKDNSILYKSPDVIASSYGDNAPYSLTVYDALNRPVSVTTAGADFANKPSRMTYTTNLANEVILYGVDDNGQLTEKGCYGANSLSKETTIDPDGKTMETFKDLFGKVVMQRAGGSLCTYYVYDALDQLRFVLPPKYQSDQDVAGLCYEYRYDDRGRLEYKKLPGAGYVKNWYDDADRLICMQDAVLRNAGRYRFYCYDRFGRQVVQGLCTSRPSAAVFHSTFSPSTTGLHGTGYSTPAGIGAVELEIVNYYDGAQRGVSYFASLTLPSTTVSQLGQLTGVITATTNGNLMAQAMQYDIKGNIVCTITKDIGGRIVSTTSDYTFTNQLAQSTTTIGVGYGGNMTVTESISYNPHNNQKSSYAFSLNHGAVTGTAIGYEYDNLGHLSTVTRSASMSTDRSVSYAYDLRGWMTGISSDSFTETLLYAHGPGTAYYNGNISSIIWKDSSMENKRGYRYGYDAANRLTSGTYSEGNALTSNFGRYSEQVRYDDNGNITSIIRNGKTVSGYGAMDNLTITYNGNQLASVSETVADNNTNGTFEYKKANGSGYIYNENGSLVADKSRGIAYITYDWNNNPKQIYFTNGSVTKYVYSASGQKLRAVHYTAKPNITRTWGVKPAELTAAQILQADSTDYLMGGSLTMKNGRIDKYLFEGGYAQASPSGSNNDTFAFYYYNQDHLGNIREVVDASGEVKQVTNYYPFGAPYADASASMNPDFQPYKYSGKELDKMHGLNTYDHGTRQYDPILARWDRLDPLAEKYYPLNPYNYCGNSPIKNIDPDGSKIVDSNGRIVIINREEDKLVFSKNASSDIKTVVNALNLTDTGRKQLDKLINSDTNVSITISERTDIQSGKSGKAYCYGTTVQGNFNKNDNYGTYYKNGKFGIKEASITINRGTIKEGIKKGSGLKHEGLTENQAIGAVAGHEIEHATNKDEINKDKQAEQRGKRYPDREKIPCSIENQIINESKQL